MTVNTSQQEVKDMNPEHFKDWDLSHWQHLYGEVLAEADFKAKPEDFVVTETLSFEPCKEGEHLFLLIEKRELNTQQVCEWLAKFFQRRLRDIGYAGLKDKQSVSRQWFSVQMNVLTEPDLTALNGPGIKLIKTVRHNKKLKVGALASNHFSIRLGEVSDPEWLIERFDQVQNGVPNYFGLQRFGFKGNNLNWANRMADGEQIKNKKIKGFALSASRSYLFNQVVSARIEQGWFDHAQQGDVFLLSGTNSYFAEPVTDAIEQRLAQHDIQLSAPLFGAEQLATDGKVKKLEQEIAQSHQNWLAMLADNGLKQERRSIKLIPQKMSWQQHGSDVFVSFELPTGCFATSVLRECVRFRERDENNEDTDK